jgi:hypothetical protein
MKLSNNIQMNHQFLDFVQEQFSVFLSFLQFPKIEVILWFLPGHGCLLEEFSELHILITLSQTLSINDVIPVRNKW